MLEVTQYLAFTLDQEVFSLDISKVREVLEFSKITKIPQTPEMMIGVINLRGSVVPVVDLRIKFGMGRGDITENTVIIIIEIDLDHEATMLGVMVDAVKEVIDLDENHIEAPPKIGNRLNTELIKGMGKRDGQFIIILDIEQIFSLEELDLVQEYSDL